MHADELFLLGQTLKAIIADRSFTDSFKLHTDSNIHSGKARTELWLWQKYRRLVTLKTLLHSLLLHSSMSKQGCPTFRFSTNLILMIPDCPKDF